MENDDAKAEDVIESSLKMVRESAFFVLVIGFKYGQIPVCAKNPANLSITELEFNEAMGLKRPILLFLMAEDHPITKGDIETDQTKRRKAERVSRASQADWSRSGPPPHLRRVPQPRRLHSKSHPLPSRTSITLWTKPRIPIPRSPPPHATSSPIRPTSTPNLPTSAPINS